jgi:hypothetical protein
MIIRIALALFAASLLVPALPLAQGAARDEPASPLEIVGGLHRDMVLRLGASKRMSRPIRHAPVTVSGE